MSQKLMSADFYDGPNEEDVLANLQKKTRTGGSLPTAKAFLNMVFWFALIGGVGFVACRALWVANQPKCYSGHGASAGLTMMSFFMNMVDFNWDERFERRIRTSKHRPILSPENRTRSFGKGPRLSPIVPYDTSYSRGFGRR